MLLTFSSHIISSNPSCAVLQTATKTPTYIDELLQVIKKMDSSLNILGREGILSASEQRVETDEMRYLYLREYI